MSTNYRQARRDDSSDDECSTKRVKHAHANDDDDDEGRTLRPMQPQPKKGMVDLSKGIAGSGRNTVWADVVQEEELTIRGNVMDMEDYRRKGEGGTFVKIRRGAESYVVPSAQLEENAAALEAGKNMEELPPPTAAVSSDDPFGDTADLGEVEAFGVGPSSGGGGRGGRGGRGGGNWQPRGARGRGVRGGWMNQQQQRGDHPHPHHGEGDAAMEMGEGFRVREQIAEFRSRFGIPSDNDDEVQLWAGEEVEEKVESKIVRVVYDQEGKLEFHRKQGELSFTGNDSSSHNGGHHRGRGGGGRGWRGGQQRGGAGGFVPRGRGGPWRGGVDNRKRRWNEGCGQPKAKDPAELMDTKYSLAGLMVKGTATEFQEGLSPKELGEQISKALGERDSDTVVKICVAVGEKKALEIFEETKKAEQAGGVKVADGSRRRTPGGVFILLFKTDVDVDPAVKGSIFEESKAIQRKFVKAKRRGDKPPQDISKGLDELQAMLDARKKELAEGKPESPEEGEATPSPENDGAEELDYTEEEEATKME
ncbi:hypothetical protein PRIPAC_92971 [Pristionchus pacificus]|uniref:Phosphorylated adapter RNA export protein n=1 Tax=Pristionchus pacificus TaxID=54126 RepID=A0A2A6B9T9_PRIPA|nr:hypothetical protein PRIPAC_92971 [Pristionchus pacificus]|eukprot:PDM62652.1 hypothetical protein PRIPAC_49867 [Pristionchus pacificus]